MMQREGWGCWKGRRHLATVADEYDARSTKHPQASPKSWLWRLRQNADVAAIIAVLAGVCGGSVYIGQLHHAVIHERELRDKDVEAARKAVEAERALREKDAEAERVLREKDVAAAKTEVRLEMERRIADFLTKGDYRGVMEAIEAAKEQRDNTKVGGLRCDGGKGWRPIDVDSVSHLGLYLLLLQAMVEGASDIGASRRDGDRGSKVRYGDNAMSLHTSQRLGQNRCDPGDVLWFVLVATCCLAFVMTHFRHRRETWTTWRATCYLLSVVWQWEPSLGELIHCLFIFGFCRIAVEPKRLCR